MTNFGIDLEIDSGLDPEDEVCWYSGVEIYLLSGIEAVVYVIV